MDLAELSDMRSSLTSVRVARPGSGAAPVWTGGLLLRDGQVFSFGCVRPVGRLLVSIRAAMGARSAMITSAGSTREPGAGAGAGPWRWGLPGSCCLRRRRRTSGAHRRLVVSLPGTGRRIGPRPTARRATEGLRRSFGGTCLEREHPLSWNREAETGLAPAYEGASPAPPYSCMPRKEADPARAADRRASRTASLGAARRTRHMGRGDPGRATGLPWRSGALDRCRCR